LNGDYSLDSYGAVIFQNDSPDKKLQNLPLLLERKGIHAGLYLITVMIDIPFYLLC